MAPHGKYRWYPTHTAPGPLSLVWCNFPELENPKVPGPKPRPALVRTLLFSKDQTKASIEIAYGTTKIVASIPAYDLVISNMASIEACGLPSATRFAIDRCIWLPWCEEFFVPRDGHETPVLGKLDQQSLMQLEAVKVFRRALGAKE